MRPVSPRKSSTTEGGRQRTSLRHLLWAGMLVGVVAHPAGASLISPPTPGTTSTASVPPDYKGVAGVEKAIEALRRRDPEEAVRLLTDAASKNKDLPAPKLLFARLLMFEGRAVEARLILEDKQVYSDNATNPEFYNCLGNVAMLEGRFNDAQLAFEKAASLVAGAQATQPAKDRMQSDSNEGLSLVWEARQNWKNARAPLDALVKLQPKNGRARQRLARSLFFLDEADNSYKQLQQASTDEPEIGPAQVSMGWLYSQKGDLSKAEEWMRKAIKDNPKNPKAYSGLASWLLNNNRLDDAKKNAEEALKLEPSSQQTKILLGAIAMNRRAFADAERIFQDLYQLSPGDAFLTNQLALALIEQNDPSKQQRALQLAEVNYRQFPRSPECMSTLGRVYYRMGRMQEAESLLAQAVNSGRTTSDTAYFYSHVLADKGQLDRVKQLLRMAVDAKGPFVFRQDAQEWLDRMAAKPQ